MGNEAIINAVADIIEAETARFPGEERLAEAMRAAAFLAVAEVDGVTSGIFGAAAERCGLHRQSSMNRYNESRAVWGEEFQFQG